MSKLTDLYNGLKAERQERLADIATKADVEKREADRRNYPPVPANNYPPPGWQDNPNDQRREWMRENEREINRQNNSLMDASAKFNRDFDQSR